MFILKRKVFNMEDCVVQQRTDNSFFSIVDVTKVINKYRAQKQLPLVKFDHYLKQVRNKEFVDIARNKLGIEPFTRSRGRSNGSFAHPNIIIDYVMWAAPEFRWDVLEWLKDKLIEVRVGSSESFKEMSNALYPYYNKEDFRKVIIKLSMKIKKQMNVEDWNEADEASLATRDKLQSQIAKLCELVNSPDEAIKLAWELEFGKGTYED